MRGYTIQDIGIVNQIETKLNYKNSIEKYKNFKCLRK